jgi:hypothetical protein
MKAAYIMAMVNEFFDSNGLSWDPEEAICTNSALALLGINSGSTAFVKKMNPEVINKPQLNLNHFKMAEAIGLKIIASRPL